MSVTAGLTVAALTSLSLALACAGVLGRASGTRTGGRAPYRLLAVGTALGTLGLIGTAATVVPGEDPGPGRLAPFAFGLGAGSLVLLLGVLRLHARGGAVRHVLDGLVIASCTLYVGWTLVIEPAYRAHLGPGLSVLTRPRLLLVAGPAVLAVGVSAVLAVLVWRAAGPRASVVVTGAGVALTGASGVGLLAALRHGDGSLVAALGVLYGLSQLTVAGGARRADRVVRPDEAAHGARAAGRRALVTWVPVLCAIAAAALRLTLVHSIDNVGAVIAGLIGVTLCARQASALREAHGYADELAREREALRELAHSDALTGLGNRRRLADALRRAGSPPVLLAIDLDGFKNVNDMRGHDVGDTVLVEVAHRLRANLRPGDLPVRLGGDEFAVLMVAGRAQPEPGCGAGGHAPTGAGLEEAERVAARLLAVLSQPYQVDGVAVFLSASIGLAGGAGATDVTTLLRDADVSLRFAKQRGKNRVERFDAAYEHWLRRRTTLEHELRGALERDELSLAYQPVLSLPDARPVGAEALLRWYHPGLGQVSPAEFIPVAEEAGLVGQLDRWVLHQACHQLSRWLADGHDVWLSVNISSRELHLPEYVPQVLEVLRAHRLPPGRLVLEVTEHAVAVDLDELAQRLGALRAAGVRIALDDFGAGYSSLGQLRRLPVDIIKIDRSLVAEPAGTLVEVVVGLGARLGLEVVAEGVSEAAQRAAVEAAGCRLGQGDVLHPPMLAEHVEALLARDMTAQDTGSAHIPAQNLGQVDSGREMRQA
ncbi:MAG: diguanylate cyclase [Micromonosporaceae bacterium]